MANVLLLVHRIPYPPNKGDKIRSYHLLRYLAAAHRVFLGAFVDDANDWQYRDKLQALCSETRLLPLNKKLAILKSLSGLLRNKALTLPYYESRDMQQWVDRVLMTHSIDHIIVFSSSMAQYVEADRLKAKNRIIDFVDVDSDKWRQYAASKRWPFSWIYRRESSKLLAYERRTAAAFNISSFVSRQEADLFKSLAPESAGRIRFFNNGVDFDFFAAAAAAQQKNPYASTSVPLVFVGAMDYWANQEAVLWFVQNVFPKIKTAIPQAVYFIVGSNPGKPVQALHDPQRGIVVTGRVDDVRPYLLHATAAVLTLRIARGIQNKVLEAMAIECPVIATSQAIEGIDAEDKKDYLLADSADQIIAAVTRLAEDKDYRHAMIRSARKHVEQHYSWSDNLQVLDQWMR